MKSIISYGVFPCIILSGLFLNLIELAVYCLLRPLSEKLFRKVNHYLQYSCWSQTVAVVDWCTNLKCHVTYKDETSKREFGQYSGLVMANHRYDIDWLAAWMLSDKLRTLGNDKAMLKSSLRYVPVIGWGWALNDMMFVSRDWNKDRENVAKSMDRLLTYDRSLLLAYFEGTRFTEVKHAASLKFAEERNISVRLKHHLLPRVRGFQLLLQRIKNGLKSDPSLKYGIFNMQVGLKSDRPVSMTKVLSGQPADLYIYVEKVDIDKIPDSEEEVTEWLYKLYQSKDELHEHFTKNGRFPGVAFDYKPRIATLLNWAFWMIVVYVSFFYCFMLVLYQGLTDKFTTGGMVYLALASLFMVSILVAIRILINSTRVSKSSAYGTTTKKSK